MSGLKSMLKIETESFRQFSKENLTFSFTPNRNRLCNDFTKKNKKNADFEKKIQQKNPNKMKMLDELDKILQSNGYKCNRVDLNLIYYNNQINQTVELKKVRKKVKFLTDNSRTVYRSSSYYE